MPNKVQRDILTAYKSSQNAQEIWIQTLAPFNMETLALVSKIVGSNTLTSF